MCHELKYYSFLKEQKECNCDCDSCDKKDTDDCCKNKGKCSGNCGGCKKEKK